MSEFNPFAATAPLIDEQQGPPEHKERVEFVPFSAMLSNPFQPRQIFSDTELEELKASILEHGVMQKPLLRPDPEIDEGFQIIAGERRIRAAQLIPAVNGMMCVIREATDMEVAQMGYAENAKRVDLNVIEIAFHYQTMINEFGMSQKDLAAEMKVSEPVISNRLRLLQLPESVVAYIRENRLSEAHGKILCSLVPHQEPIFELAAKAISESLSTRALEDLVKARKAAIEAREADERAAANPVLPLEEPKAETVTHLTIERWRILECLERNAGMDAEELATVLGLDYTLVEQSCEYLKELGLLRAEFSDNANHWFTTEPKASDRLKQMGSLPVVQPQAVEENSNDAPALADPNDELTLIQRRVLRYITHNPRVEAGEISGALDESLSEVQFAIRDLLALNSISGEETEKGTVYRAGAKPEETETNEETPDEKLAAGIKAADDFAKSLEYVGGTAVKAAQPLVNAIEKVSETGQAGAASLDTIKTAVTSTPPPLPVPQANPEIWAPPFVEVEGAISDVVPRSEYAWNKAVKVSTPVALVYHRRLHTVAAGFGMTTEDFLQYLEGSLQNAQEAAE